MSEQEALPKRDEIAELIWEKAVRSHPYGLPWSELPPDDFYRVRTFETADAVLALFEHADCIEQVTP